MLRKAARRKKEREKRMREREESKHLFIYLIKVYLIFMITYRVAVTERDRQTDRQIGQSERQTGEIEMEWIDET